MTADSTSSNSTPFEWLSGGLFFGKNKGGIESIDSSNDVTALLKGVAEDLAKLTSPNQAQQASDSAGQSDPEKFLEARTARLRFLLYDERRITSQQDSRRSNPAVAGRALQVLTGNEFGDLIPSLLDNLAIFPFESRKHVAAIFNYLLVSGLDGGDFDLYRPLMERFRDYIESHFDRIMTAIVDGHDTSRKGGASDVGLHFGTMYRSCLRHTSLYQQLVGSTEHARQYVFPFLDKYVHVPNFEIASDAMESLKVVFTAGGDKIPEESQARMAELAGEFLTRDYDEVWTMRFNPKLLSDSANYMTRRVALQILSTVLLTRSNYAVMIKYVASRENLILVMSLLRDTSPHITLDAFHVFKVFVANPNKPPEVVKILRDNKVKLCKYLTTLHQDKEANDTQFRDEKALIVKTIDSL